MSGILARLGNIFCCDGDRGKWPGRFDFIVAAISYTRGLRFVMRMPYWQYRNLGDVFLFPYILLMVFVGLPLVLFEVSLGQLTSSGVMTCWKFAPVIQGIGLGMVFVSAISSIADSRVCAILFYYMFSSFTLPWSKCGQERQTQLICYEDTQNQTKTTECDRLTDVCWNTSNFLPEEYLFPHVQWSELNKRINDLGPVVWRLALCSLLVWVLIAVCLSKSVRSYGKVAYFTTICPVCILIILFMHGLTLERRDVDYKSDNFYFQPFSVAAQDVIYGLSLSHGGLITLSSYNRFNGDIIRSSALLCAVQVVLMLLSRSMVFFYLNTLAYARNKSIDKVVDSTYTLILSMIPDTFLMTGAPALWTVLWFLMLSSWCFGSMLGFVETVVTAILDVFPNIRRYRPLVVVAVCSLLCLLGLPLTTQRGEYFAQFLYDSGYYWYALVFPILELMALIIYGVPRFLTDVETMVGRRICWCNPKCYILPWKVIAGFFLLFPTIAMIVFINLVVWFDTYWIHPLPLWAVCVVRAMYWTPTVFIICGALLSVYQARTRLRGNWFAFLTPSTDWGPALPEHRAMMNRCVQESTEPPTEVATSTV